MPICAGGENGFNQAIELAADTLANVKFVQEKRLISKFFDEISQDTGKYVSGVSDTLSCLDMGAIETLVVWEDLQVCSALVSSDATLRALAPALCSSSCLHVCWTKPCSCIGCLTNFLPTLPAAD